MQHDRTINFRVDMELAHRLERTVAKTNAARADYNKDPRRKPMPMISLSDLIRNALVIGLDLQDGNANNDKIEDLLLNEFRDKLLAMLALPASNPGALALLKKIAANAEPDFG